MVLALVPGGFISPQTVSAADCGCVGTANVNAEDAADLKSALQCTTPHTITITANITPWTEGDVALGANHTINTNNQVTISGVISGAFSLTKINHGRLTLTGTNTYTGGTIVNDGDLYIGDNKPTGSVSDTRGIAVGGSGMVHFNRSDDVTYGGIISGTGTLYKKGAGVLTLTGSNTFSGGTTVQAGTLQLDSDHATNAGRSLTISAGATLINNAVLTVNGTLHNNGGTLTNNKLIIVGASGSLIGVNKLNLNANGGTYAIGAVAEPVLSFDITKLPTDPTRSGHTFNGWFTEATGGTKITGSHTFANNGTIHAQWTATGSSRSSGGGSTQRNSVSVTKADYDTAKGGDVSTDLNTVNGTLNAVKNGSYTLKEGTDYTVSGNRVTIKGSYLAGLSGTQTITFEMSAGVNPTLTINIIDSETPLEPTAPTGPQPMKPMDPAGTIADATKTNNPLFINGGQVDFPAVKIGGWNWLKLRDVAAILNGTEKQFGISYDETTRTISITTGASYTPLGDELLDLLEEAFTAVASGQKIMFDGSIVEVAAYNVDGYNYFRLRDLMILLDIAVIYDEATGEITLDLTKPYTE